MRSVLIFLFSVLGVLSLLITTGWVTVAPWHGWQSKWNTDYSEKFSWERFNQVTNGMTRDGVTNLLGAVMASRTDSARPGWAMHDSSGKVYASNQTYRIEWLYFSKPKNFKIDYEWVHVVLGPEGTVIDKHHYITD